MAKQRYVIHGLHAWRHAKGFPTARELADAADVCAQTIHNIEAGRHDTTRETLRRIARALNVPQYKLLGREWL